MAAHAVLRLAGHRLRFVPFPPYRLMRLTPGADTPRDSLHMVRVDDGEVRQFELRPGAPDAPPAELTRVEEPPEGWAAYRMGPRGAEVRLRSGITPRIDADGSLTAGPDANEWVIETTLFQCAWPEGLTLTSTEEGAPGPFEFHGSRGSVLFLQGPVPRERLPAPAEMVQAGQRVLALRPDAVRPSVDVAYDVDGQTWLQRHVVVPLSSAHALVVTAQALEAQAPRMFEHAVALAASIRPAVTIASPGA